MNIFREYINERGLRVEFVARKMGVTQSCLYAIFKTNREPTLRVAVAIERFTDGKIKCADLLAKEDDSKKGESKKIDEK